MTHYLIAPSLLSADFARLGEESDNVLASGGDLLHLDIMDNHYVPNLTVGPLVCAALRNYGITAPIDVHLMVTPVDSLIGDFAKAGASAITFHPEASYHIDRSLQLIKSHGCKAGLALNPATPLDCLEYVWDKLDQILVMSVNPGFGGQSFIPSALEKIRQLRELINKNKRDIIIGVDGGIKPDNIYDAAKAGAQLFVAGSAIFSQPNYADVISSMRKELLRVKS